MNWWPAVLNPPDMPHTFEWESDGPDGDDHYFNVWCSLCKATRGGVTAATASDWALEHESVCDAVEECEACGVAVADLSAPCPALCTPWDVHAHVRRLSEDETVYVDA